MSTTDRTGFFVPDEVRENLTKEGSQEPAFSCPRVNLHQTAVDALDIRLAATSHLPGGLGLQQLQHGLDAVGSVSRQTPHGRPAKQNGLRSQGQRL